MKLNALFDLREALEDAAIYGTDRMEKDDLSLRHAVECFSPLAKEKQLLARLMAETNALPAAERSERPGRLLDALGHAYSAERLFAEADVAGELTPLKPGCGSCVNAAYSRLQPLIAALGGGGAGRLSVIEEAWANNPEYFGDYRVLPYLADALGDTNEELEDLLAVIFSTLGARAVPFLEDGFAPDGMRGMARRVYWVARLAGAAENDWLLSILPATRREVREAAICALGVSQENAALLRELYAGETGKSRDAALRALARMEDEESRALWVEELEARPDCPPCLEGVDSALAADMAARALRDVLTEALAREKPECNQAQLLTVAHAVYAAYGKYSDALREEWLFWAEQMDALERLCPDRSVKNWDYSAAEMLEKCMMETVLWNPSEGVCALADELGERFPAHFLGAAVLAALLAKPEEAFDRYGKLIVKNGILRRENAQDRAKRIQIMRALAAVRFDADEGWYVPFSRKDALNGTLAGRIYRLRSFDERWAETMSSPKVNSDGGVFDLENPWSMEKKLFRLEELLPQEENAPPAQPEEPKE